MKIDPRTLSPEQIRVAAEQLSGGLLARFLDSTLLKADATAHEIEGLVNEAVRMGAHICVNPSRLSLVRERLAANRDKQDWKILVSAVIGFPLGASTTSSKVAEAEDAFSMAADEIDMVANIGLLKDGDKSGFRDDIDAVATIVADFNSADGANRTLKVIIECCYLNEDEKRFAAETVGEIGINRGIPVFVKTSTGLGKPPAGVPSGATINDVLLIRKSIGDYDPESNPVGVKAAGGISDANTAIQMLISAGAFDDDLNLTPHTYNAARIGTSSAKTVQKTENSGPK